MRTRTRGVRDVDADTQYRHRGGDDQYGADKSKTVAAPLMPSRLFDEDLHVR